MLFLLIAIEIGTGFKPFLVKNSTNEPDAELQLLTNRAKTYQIKFSKETEPTEEETVNLAITQLPQAEVTCLIQYKHRKLAKQRQNILMRAIFENLNRKGLLIPFDNWNEFEQLETIFKNQLVETEWNEICADESKNKDFNQFKGKL